MRGDVREGDLRVKVWKLGEHIATLFTTHDEINVTWETPDATEKSTVAAFVRIVREIHAGRTRGRYLNYRWEEA